MKALILSGGKGTRLRPITFTSAKQLVPVANKPILFYGLEAVREAGIVDVGIVVGDTADEVRKAVGSGEQFGLKVDYIPQEAPLGLAHAVKIAKDYMRDEPFVMYLGDNLLKNGIRSFVSEFADGKCDAQILLARVPNPSEFGVAEIEEGRVVGLEEKPKKPKSDYALVGVYMFTNSIFEAVEQIKPSWRNELEITDAIQYLIDKGFVVNSHIVEGWWKDTGKLEDILDANHMILAELTARLDSEPGKGSEIHGNVQTGKKVNIEGSVLRGPCIIGDGASIIDSYIGPFTSIGPNTQVIRSEVENSIILEECTIKDIGSRIGNSLIGRNVTVAKTVRPPKSYEFMVGDNSNIIIL
ncbi:MAG: glucose-1-phosphate thymidylyltransferase [Candidatus Latescibacterota bacterium]|nr:MAG: glucose-1-phosphate thymidylyltransferase [Candidatus Latescibacterota bacterium]